MRLSGLRIADILAPYLNYDFFFVLKADSAENNNKLFSYYLMIGHQ